MKKYCVYELIFPDGCVYVGMTCQRPSDRWQGGRGYQDGTKVKDHIRAYGWNKVQKNIIFEGLTKESAANLETRCIEEYVRSDKSKVLNMVLGTNMFYSTDWQRTPLSEERLSAYQYGRYHHRLDDDWLEPYMELVGGNSNVRCNFSIDSVSIAFLTFTLDEIGTEEYRIDYPDGIITFRDLYNFLLTFPKWELVRSISVTRSALQDALVCRDNINGGLTCN